MTTAVFRIYPKEHSFNFFDTTFFTVQLQLYFRHTITISNISGSGGDATSVPPPQTGSNSFVFTYIFTKKCLRQRSVPPQWLGAPPQREILDPPLCKHTRIMENSLGSSVPERLQRYKMCASKLWHMYVQPSLLCYCLE